MKPIVRHLFIVLIGLTVGINLYALYNNTPYINDSVEYQKLEKNLLDSNKLYCGVTEKIDYRMFTKRSVGFPSYLMFQNSLHSIVIVSQILLIIFNFILGLQVLRSLKSKKSSLVSFCLFYILYIPLLLHSSFVLADLLLATTVTLIVTIFHSKTSTQEAKVISIAVLWLFALAIKPVIIPSLIFVPIIFFWLWTKQKRCYPILLAPIVFWLIMSAVGFSYTDQFQYSSISTINLTQYNGKLTISAIEGYDSAQAFMEQSAFEVPRSKKEFAEYNEGVKNIGFDIIKTHPIAYAKVHFMGMVKMMLDPGRFEIYTYLNEPTNQESLTEMLYARNWERLSSYMKQGGVAFLIFSFLLFVSVFKVLLALFGLKRIESLWFLLLTIAYFVVITGPVGAARFFIPVGVLFLVLVSVGTETVLDFFKKSSKS